MLPHAEVHPEISRRQLPPSRIALEPLQKSHETQNFQLFSPEHSQLIAPFPTSDSTRTHTFPTCAPFSPEFLQHLLQTVENTISSYHHIFSSLSRHVFALFVNARVGDDDDLSSLDAFSGATKHLHRVSRAGLVPLALSLPCRKRRCGVPRNAGFEDCDAGDVIFRG